MANLTPEMKDISFNNSFGFRPMPGTCELCTFGRGAHAEFCVRLRVSDNAPKAASSKLMSPGLIGDTITVRKPLRYRL